MKLTKMLVVTAVFLSALGLASAAELVGTWNAEFDSPIGVQKYKYEFSMTEGKLAGKATYSQSMSEGTVSLKDILLKGDEVSFTEALNIGGNEVLIAYAGKIKGDEMNLTRKVGDFGTEVLVAKRVQVPAPENKPAAPK